MWLRIPLLAVLLGCCAGASAHCTTPDTLQPLTTIQAEERGSVRIYGAVGWSLGVGSADFFRVYQSLLGGRAAGFDIPIGVSAGMQSYQFGDAAIGLMTGYSRAVLRETYAYDPREMAIPIGPAQSVGQTILMTVIPAMATVDYLPRRRQFTGYLGAGVGIASVDLYWAEQLSSTSEPGGRASGVRYDKQHFVPAVMARAGVSLGFDDPLAHRTRAGVYFEATYQYMPLQALLMERLAKSLPASSGVATTPFDVQAGGLVLRIGFQVALGSPQIRR